MVRADMLHFAPLHLGRAFPRVWSDKVSSGGTEYWRWELFRQPRRMALSVRQERIPKFWFKKW